MRNPYTALFQAVQARRREKGLERAWTEVKEINPYQVMPRRIPGPPAAFLLTLGLFRQLIDRSRLLYEMRKVH
jgi:hypothetical protein